MRERFETWANEKGTFGNSWNGDLYENPLHQAAWQGWQAALSSAGTSGTATKLVLQKPDDMIAWLNDLGSTWAVLRNCRDFMEAAKGGLGHYWKQLDKLMGTGFELQIALMKLRGDSLSGKGEATKEK